MRIVKIDAQGGVTQNVSVKKKDFLSAISPMLSEAILAEETCRVEVFTHHDQFITQFVLDGGIPRNTVGALREIVEEEGALS